MAKRVEGVEGKEKEDELVDDQAAVFLGAEERLRINQMNIIEQSISVTGQHMSVTVPTIEELRFIADVLKDNKTIMFLRMEICMSLDSNCGEILTQILDPNSSIEGLWLYVKAVEHSGIEMLATALANSRLKIFAFWESNINDEQLAILSEVFSKHQSISHIEVVSLFSEDEDCFSSSGTYALARAVSNNPVITRVEINPAEYKHAEINFTEACKIIKILMI